MPRTPKERKIGNTPAESIKRGLLMIRDGESIRKTSTKVNVPFSTLKRYHNKFKDTTTSELKNLTEARLEPNYSVNKIFTEDQELSLKNYITHCALLFYGLSTKECRNLAYQCAKINNLKVPESWDKKQMAGKDWLISFRNRNKISLKKPEPCSLARATAFNRSNVNKFYDNLANVLARSPNFADGTRIFNLDETSTTTVQVPQKVLVPTGNKTPGKVTSGERGTLVTTCCIVSASGNFLPPAMVFPRVKFKDHMTKNTPTGTLGLAAKTGWMNSTIFPKVMAHFIKYTHSSKENPSLLIMDNHESHYSLEALDLAKNAGVHILTLPPHTSAKLQPLDVGVFGPFKTFYNSAIDSWLLRNPGTPITIYDLGEIIGYSFQNSMTPRNITSAFAKCGIYPFDRHIFTDEDFMPSSVTDRPCPENLHREEASTPDSLSILVENQTHPDSPPHHDIDLPENSPPNLLLNVTEEPTGHDLQNSSTLTSCVPSTSETSSRLNKSSATTKTHIENAPSTSKQFVSPFEFRDPIKAGPRNTNRKRRRPGRSLIATDTPEKQIIEQEKKAKTNKKEAKIKNTCRTILDSDEDMENEKVIFAESDEDDDWMELAEEEDLEDEDGRVVITEKNLNSPLPRMPKEGEHVLVQLTTKKRRSLYIGKVIEERNNDLEYYVSFLRRKPGTEKFVMPNKPDLSLVKEDDLKCILPKPTMIGTASRSFFIFGVNLTLLTVS